MTRIHRLAAEYDKRPQARRAELRAEMDLIKDRADRFAKEVIEHLGISDKRSWQK